MASPAYSEDDVRRWLGWLASGMRKHGQSVFVLEQLQPSWLLGGERRVFCFHSLLAQYSILVVPCWIEIGILAWSGGWRDITDVLGHALFLLFEATSRGPVNVIMSFLFALSVMSFGVLYQIGGLGMLLIKKRFARPIAEYIRPAERLSWSFGRFWTGLFPRRLQVPVSEQFVWFLTLPFTFVRCLADGLSATEISGKTAPNRGIFLSGRNSLYFLAPGFVPLLFLPFLELDGLSQLAISLIAICAYPAAWYGGFDAIDHFLLRRRMLRLGYAPKDYVAFLDYAANELGFLQKAGGSYLFMHRQLLEYFADEYEAATGQPQDVPTQPS